MKDETSNTTGWDLNTLDDPFAVGIKDTDTDIPVRVLLSRVRVSDKLFMEMSV